MRVATIEPHDEHHESCARLVKAAREARVVPAPVLVKLESLLRVASDTAAFKAFLENCSTGAFTVAAPAFIALTRHLHFAT